MSPQSHRKRQAFAGALLAFAGALTGVLGCQSIADIPDRKSVV